MIEFFLMGGYALYVWSSYAITAFVLATLIIFNGKKHRKILCEITDTGHDRKRENHE